MRRTQIYLDEHQDRQLGERARALGTTKSGVIRDAIDRFLDADDRRVDTDLARLHTALAEAAGAAPDLPSGTDYVDAVRAADVERERRLQAARER